MTRAERKTAGERVLDAAQREGVRVTVRIPRPGTGTIAFRPGSRKPSK